MIDNPDEPEVEWNTTDRSSLGGSRFTLLIA